MAWSCKSPPKWKNLTGDPAALSSLEFTLTFTDDRTKNIES